MFSIIDTAQTGNPINFHLSNTSFVGAAVLRPDVTGPVMTGFTPATNGIATYDDLRPKPVGVR